MNPEVSREAVSETMGKLIKSGDIGGWGLSQIYEKQLRLAHSITPLTAVQSEYSMMERMFEKDVIPACGELGVGFVAFSPMGAGFLSGKHFEKDKYSGDDVRRVITRFIPENITKNQPILDLLQKFADKKRLKSSDSAGLDAA